MNCPKCASPLSLLPVRAEIHCPRCGSRLSCNLDELIGTVGLVFFALVALNTAAFYWLFGTDEIITLCSNLAVAAETALVYLYLLPRKLKVDAKPEAACQVAQSR